MNTPVKLVSHGIEKFHGPTTQQQSLPLVFDKQVWRACRYFCTWLMTRLHARTGGAQLIGFIVDLPCVIRPGHCEQVINRPGMPSIKNSRFDFQ
jgi:hypothetical protein